MKNYTVFASFFLESGETSQRIRAVLNNLMQRHMAIYDINIETIYLRL